MAMCDEASSEARARPAEARHRLIVALTIKSMVALNTVFYIPHGVKGQYKENIIYVNRLR